MNEERGETRPNALLRLLRLLGLQKEEMAMELIDRIEAAARVATDEGRPVAERVEAADEVLLWAGPELARAAIARALKVGRD